MHWFITGSIFLVTQVLDREATVKCQDILERTYLLYKRTLFLGCSGSWSMSCISSPMSDVSLDSCSSSDMLKSKNLPKYLKGSSILTVGMRLLLISSFGKHCVDFVGLFLILKVLHLSTRIVMFDHWHQIEDAFKW